MSDVGDVEIERFLRAHGPFEEPPILACGDCVGDWEICAFLGHGGSAQVYRAVNITTGLVAALKILSRSDGRTRVRFKRETRLLAEVRSSSFPRFYGAGECGGRLYIAEELLEPMPLPDDDAAVARLVLAVADAVAELHRRGFIHRDIKPGNVMMRPATGESVLIDMGLAKESEGMPDAATDTTSVADGHVVGVGTPGFSAPEQFVGGAIGPAADIHALGMLANACFDGKPPRSWTRIIRRSTSSIPEQRYSSIASFTRAIRRRHAGLWWFLGILFAMTMAIAAIALRPLGDRPQGHGDRPQGHGTNKPITAKRLLEAMYDADYGDAWKNASKGEAAITTTNAAAGGKSNWQKLFDSGKTRYIGGVLVTRIELSGRDVTIQEKIKLEGRRKVEIVGPGRLTVSITGSREASLELSEQAVLINRTTVGYPASDMKYILNGACYLNFKNLDPPADKDYKNIGIGEGKGRPSFRFRGPDSYEEVRKADKKAAIEAMSQGIVPYL